MPVLKFSEFSRALGKGELAPVYYFHGDRKSVV
jgi:hypothetical protein